jgi:hypothetical protein
MNRVFPGTLFLFFLCTCFSTLSLQAQDTTSQAPRWDIGINMLPLINKQSTPDASILIRYKINPHTYIRTRLGAEFSLRERSIPVDDRFYIRPGLEFAKVLRLKSSIHYGIDVQYEREKMTLFIVNTQRIDNFRVEEFSSYRRTIGSGLFLGYRYMVLENLSFYIETGFNFENPKYKVNKINGLIAIDGQITPGTVMITGFRYANSYYFYLKPLQLFNLSFHF